jgi:hypothetical protein
MSRRVCGWAPALVVAMTSALAPGAAATDPPAPAPASAPALARASGELSSRGFHKLYEGASRADAEVVYLQPGEPQPVSKEMRRNFGIPPGPWPTTRLVSIDGVKVPGDGTAAIEFLPGPHALVISLANAEGGELWSIDKDWVANTIYMTGAVWTRRGWTANIECSDLYVAPPPSQGAKGIKTMQCGIDRAQARIEGHPEPPHDLIEQVR